MTTNKVPFEILAPYNKDVMLLGSWNQWKPVPMQRGDDGIWRLEVPLEDGEYQYKFQMVSLSYFAEGQTVQVADPKALQFTLDSRENSIVRVKGSQRVTTTYEWQHDDKPLPSNDELIIYEMHVGDFRGGPGDTDDKQGTFQRVIEKLNYLVDLGVNAIELMPVNEFPGHHAWGYSQRSIYAIENSYGSPDELCRLVDECHARGIRVIHDAVYNHMEMDAPLTKIDYTYWFYREDPSEPALQFGPKFNYEHCDEKLNRFPAREHVIGAMYQWVNLFHIDGIRFDCTRALKYFDLLRWFHDEMHGQVDGKPFYTIAEHVPQDPAIAGPDGPMDAAWHENFYYQMEATVLGIERGGRQPFDTNEVLRLLDGRQDGFGGSLNTVKYHDNHDHDRLAWLLGAAANTYDEAAFRRLKLGATLLLTAPGIPMLWMGQEFGQSTQKQIEPVPLHWSLLENANNQGLFNHYKFLIGLRKSTPALYSNTFEPIANWPERGILAFKRWTDAGGQVVVVANLKDEFAGAFEIGAAGLEDGQWHEGVYNYDVQVEGGCLRDSLAESEVKVYIKQ
ncbi:MAG: alpha-amylase family glycosyl hydrolase [bacterium]|nr:alpha-amylase family glycosyl hydrolase [bacterium]